ncbi:MAG: AsmA family protein, partial [Bacteroidota bacterium]
MLKKILFTLVGLIVLVVLSAIILPVLFKDDIFKIVKEEINNNVNAKVDFGDFGLTLFKSFPDFTLSIDQVKVEGIGTFEGVELASIGSLEVTVDLMSAIGGENIEVVSFGLVNPSIHLKVLEDGTANYDIAKESEAAATEEPEAEESTGASPGLSLQEYFIENANVIYDDAQGGLYARIENLTHRGNGDFTEEIVALATRTTAEAITYKMDGITYLNAVRTDITFNLEMDMPNSKYTFKENEVNLNELGLAFDGYVQMPGEDIDMDLRFEARQTEFKSILSLVPGVYTQDFAAVQTGGKLALQGNAKGTYSEGSLPAFDVGLQISDAHFKYPDLPKSAENIQVDLSVQNKDGVEDHTVIDVNTFHVELAGNPLDLQLHLRTPISDPYIDATIQSQLNLASLKDVVPMEEGQSYSGSVTMDVRLKGNQSAIDNEQYEQFDAQGKVIVLDIDYQDPELPYAMNVEKAYMDFSP